MKDRSCIGWLSGRLVPAACALSAWVGTAHAADDASSTSVAHPAGTGSVVIEAVGSACPAGTWDAKLTPDRRIEVSFRAAALRLDAHTDSVANDCKLSLRFANAGYRELSLWAVSMSSFVEVDTGVTARLTGEFRLHDTLAGKGTFASELVRTTAMGTAIGMWNQLSTEVGWTRCSAAQTLDAHLKYTLQNASEPATGTLNDLGSGGLRLPTVTFEILSRSCFGWTPVLPDADRAEP